MESAAWSGILMEQNSMTSLFPHKFSGAVPDGFHSDYKQGLDHAAALVWIRMTSLHQRD